MGLHHIALMGKARSGKDTIAGRLVAQHAYTRLAFADHLKVTALQVDPIVSYELAGTAYLPTRLSSVVHRMGWDVAKERIPEVRRVLQHMGQGVRDLDPEFWLRPVLELVKVADQWNMPIVVTDVRYPNEVERLSAAGFTLVRVTRSGRPDSASGEEVRTRQHASETALDGYPSDITIANEGSMSALHKAVDRLVP